MHQPGRGLPDDIFSGDFKTAKKAFERQYVRRRLEESRGNIRQAARRAELDYKNFHSKMTRYGIDPTEFK